jgi:nicotinamide-nucleotide amidase
MVESNARQALMLDGAEPLINEVGMAVGCAFEHQNTKFILLPGPPREMKTMFTNYAAPWIRSIFNETLPLYTMMLKFSGIGESSLEDQVLDLIENQQYVSIAPYAKEGEVAIRLAVKAENEQLANVQMRPIVEEMYRRFPNHLYSTSDESLEEAVMKLLLEKKQTICVAESMTGGRIGDLLTSISGSSSVFVGGFLTYSNDLKNKLLHIPIEFLEGEQSIGAISKEVAELMAVNAQKISGATYAVSVTGNAGPNPAENKPTGLTYIAMANESGVISSFELQLHGNRDTIKQRAAKQVLYMIWKTLQTY